MSPNRPEPWERQPGETTRAFEAFAVYRDIGPSRSTAKVARALSKSKTLADRWCSAWEWVPRARAYDAWADEQALRANAVEYSQVKYLALGAARDGIEFAHQQIKHKQREFDAWEHRYNAARAEADRAGVPLKIDGPPVTIADALKNATLAWEMICQVTEFEKFLGAKRARRERPQDDDSAFDPILDDPAASAAADRLVEAARAATQRRKEEGHGAS